MQRKKGVARSEDHQMETKGKRSGRIAPPPENPIPQAVPAETPIQLQPHETAEPDPAVAPSRLDVAVPHQRSAAQHSHIRPARRHRKIWLRRIVGLNLDRRFGRDSLRDRIFRRRCDTPRAFTLGFHLVILASGDALLALHEGIYFSRTLLCN